MFSVDLSAAATLSWLVYTIHYSLDLSAGRSIGYAGLSAAMAARRNYILRMHVVAVIAPLTVSSWGNINGFKARAQ